MLLLIEKKKMRCRGFLFDLEIIEYTLNGIVSTPSKKICENEMFKSELFKIPQQDFPRRIPKSP